MNLLNICHVINFYDNMIINLEETTKLHKIKKRNSNILESKGQIAI